MCNAESFKVGDEAIYTEDYGSVRVRIKEKILDEAAEQISCKLEVLKVLSRSRFGHVPEIGSVLEVSEYTKAPGVYAGGWRLETLQEHGEK